MARCHEMVGRSVNIVKKEPDRRTFFVQRGVYSAPVDPANVTNGTTSSLSTARGSPAVSLPVQRKRSARQANSVEGPRLAASHATAHPTDPSANEPLDATRLLHGGLVDAINRAQFGIIITAPNSRPAFVNRYAQHLLDRQDGLVATDHGLEAAHAADTRLLRDVIAQAVNRQLTTCTTLQLPRIRSARPLIVYVPADGYARMASDRVTLYLCDPHHDALPDPSVLSRLFAFTRAEGTLAGLLMRGVTIEEAAATLFVSEHTVRTHLKRMLNKTDTGRQAELLRLLLTCAGQVRLD